MSEDAPSVPDENQRIEDPEKARAMAEREEPFRDAATFTREADAGKNMPHLVEQIEGLEKRANEVGEEAGREYDAYQTRIQDPKKAEAMAYAGDSERTAAADARRIAYRKQYGWDNDQLERDTAAGYREDAKALDESADATEAKAGEQYDASQTGTQIPVRVESDNPFPDRVEDVDKAQTMAIAGDKLRTSAVNHRIAAESPFFGGPGTEGEKSHSEQASQADNQAAQLEESAGRYYDSWPAKRERLLNEHERLLDEDFASLRQALEQGVSDDELDKIWKRLKSDGRLLHSMKISWSRDQSNASAGQNKDRS